MNENVIGKEVVDADVQVHTEEAPLPMNHPMNLEARDYDYEQD